MRPYRPSASAKIRIRIIDTYRRGCYRCHLDAQLATWMIAYLSVRSNTCVANNADSEASSQRREAT